MPLDTNQNDSWKGSSSDSDINNATNIKSEHIDSDLFMYTSTSSSTFVSHKLTHKCKKSKRCEPEVTISAGILSKRKRMTMKDKTYVGKAQVYLVY